MRLLRQCLRQGSEAWSVTEDHGSFEEGLDRFFLTTTTDDNGELCDDLYPGVVPGIFGEDIEEEM